MENEEYFSEDEDDDDLQDSSENSDKDFNKDKLLLHEKEFHMEREPSKLEEVEIEQPNEHVIVESTEDGAFGRFNEELGFGSFKRVYRGFDFNAAREVAWNVIDVLNTEEQNLSKISEEIHILKKLKHTNIIQYISGWYDQDKKQVIIITELLPGGSLKQHLSIFKTPRLRLIKTWIKEILKGLMYLHTENESKPPIIHRDIKCDNIFIDKTTGGVKIGDLGRSELLLQNYATTYAGTEEFMAPEVHEGKYTVKADIYSLGMCILEMVTLEKPYKECDSVIMNIYENVKNGILPRSLDKIGDKKLIQLIKTCLKREHERPTAVELLGNSYLNEIDSEENNHPVKLNEVFQECPTSESTYRSQNLNKDNYLPNQGESSAPCTNTLEFIPNTEHHCNKFQHCPDKTTLKYNSQSEMPFLQGDSSKPLDQPPPHKISHYSNYHQASIPKYPEKTAVKKTLYANESNSNSREDFGKADMIGISCRNNSSKSKKQASPKREIKNVTSEPSLIFDERNHYVNANDPMHIFLNNCGTNGTIGNIGKKIGIPLYPGKTHRVSLSLKNSVNPSESSCSKFEVSIVKKKDNNDTVTKNTQTDNRTTFNPTSSSTDKNSQLIHLIFLLNKETWKKKKYIECAYDLINDTIEGVVKELQREINLSEEEYQIVSNKLADFISGYKNSKQHSSVDQKNSIEAGASTTPDADIFVKKKKTYDNFFISYNKLLNKIRNLLQNENTQKIEEMKKVYDTRFRSNNSVEIQKMIDEYNKKIEILHKIINTNNI